MTLISAWRTQAGIVVAGDSQETVGNYRVEVAKLTPIDLGVWKVIVAGAGQPGTLIDSFSLRLSQWMAGFASTDIQEFSTRLDKALPRFFKEDVRLCPDPQKYVRFLIAASCPASNQYNCWTTQNTALCPLATEKPELLGWDEPLYKAIVQRFACYDITLAQAILASIYVLTIADKTSNCVKGPFSVAIVCKNGIWMESADYIGMMSERLRSYEEHINRLFLACADTEISPQRFEKTLTEFGEQVALLHKQHLDAAVQRLLVTRLDKCSNPYSQIPPGTVLRVFPGGGFEAAYDVDAKRMMADTLRAQHGTVPPPLEDEK